MLHCKNVFQIIPNAIHSTQYVQYIPRNMHTVFALLCFVVVIHRLIFPYPSGLLHWWIWINTSCEFIINDCITTTKQSTTKPCAYFLGYTVHGLVVLCAIVYSFLCSLRLLHGAWVNSLKPRQNGRLFADDTFKRIFLNDNISISTKNSLKFVPEGLINNIPVLVLIMAWRRPGDKPLSEPMMVRSLTHICVTRPQWVNRGLGKIHCI